MRSPAAAARAPPPEGSGPGASGRPGSTAGSSPPRGRPAGDRSPPRRGGLSAGASPSRPSPWPRSRSRGAPVLPGVGELVGRNPEPGIPAQVVGIGPGVGAVLPDDERLVAGEQDPVLPGDGPDRVPLLLGHELEPAWKRTRLARRSAAAASAWVVSRGCPAATPTTAAAPGPRPWPRRASSCPATPRSAVGRPRSGRRDRSPLLEAAEGSPERRPLHPDHGRVLHPVRLPRLLEQPPLLVVEGRHAASLPVLEEGVEMDEQRIQTEGAPGRVGADVAPRGGKQREHHPQSLAGAPQEPDPLLGSSEIADPEVVAAPQGEHGEQHARDASGVEHGRRNLHRTHLDAIDPPRGRSAWPGQ